MYEVKVWAFGISAVCIISSMVRFLCPSVSKASPVMIAMNLFIVLNIIYPISKLSGYSNSFVLEQAVSSQAFSTGSYYENSIKASVEKLIQDKLSDLGIKSTGILIDITVKEEQVKINRVLISLSAQDANKKPYVKEQLTKYLVLPVEVELQQ